MNIGMYIHILFKCSMIYLFMTATISPAQESWGPVDAAQRQSRYERCVAVTLHAIKDFDIIPVVVVNDRDITASFFDNFDCRVVYARNNLTDTLHKGKCELEAIHYAIDHLKLKDDDMIIKQTGRYCPCDTVPHPFFERVANNNHAYDCYVKFMNVSTNELDPNDCILGLIAMRCKYLKKFQYRINNVISAEMEVAMYIHDYIPEDRVASDVNLCVEACHASSPDHFGYIY